MQYAAAARLGFASRRSVTGLVDDDKSESYSGRSALIHLVLLRDANRKSCWPGCLALYCCWVDHVLEAFRRMNPTMLRCCRGDGWLASLSNSTRSGGRTHLVVERGRKQWMAWRATSAIPRRQSLRAAAAPRNRWIRANWMGSAVRPRRCRCAGSDGGKHSQHALTGHGWCRIAQRARPTRRKPQTTNWSSWS